MDVLPEVQANFFQAFLEVPLDLDWDTKTLRFSDGVTAEGRIVVTIKCLWARDSSSYMKMHTRDQNKTLQHHERILMFKECDVPDGARLYANQFLDIDGDQFRIISARCKDQLWNLTLVGIGSR